MQRRHINDTNKRERNRTQIKHTMSKIKVTGDGINERVDTQKKSELKI